MCNLVHVEMSPFLGVGTRTGDSHSVHLCYSRGQKTRPFPFLLVAVLFLFCF